MNRRDFLKASAAAAVVAASLPAIAPMPRRSILLAGDSRDLIIGEVGVIADGVSLGTAPLRMSAGGSIRSDYVDLTRPLKLGESFITRSVYREPGNPKAARESRAKVSATEGNLMKVGVAYGPSWVAS